MFEGGMALPRQEHLKAPSDIGGSGGVPPAGDGPGNRGAIRAHFLARSVNTEGPGP